MSDLYLVLRHRLEDVATEWVHLGDLTMLEARKRMGYSREALSRQLHVTAKTYERWEKAGRVPRADLRRVAGLLDLEIEEPERQRIPGATPDDLASDVQALRGEIAALRKELAAALPQPKPRRVAAAPRPSARRR